LDVGSVDDFVPFITGILHFLCSNLKDITDSYETTLELMDWFVSWEYSRSVDIGMDIGVRRGCTPFCDG
jgi:hypothetical protein